MSLDSTTDDGRYATVFYHVGVLQLFQAGLMLSGIVVSLGYSEYYLALAFALSAAATGLVGGVLYRPFRNAPEPDTKHALVSVGVGWFVTVVFGALPFLLAAYFVPPEVAAEYVPQAATYRSSLRTFANPLHALFESASGWTTTGLTMAVHEPSLPHGLLWWRSLMQWVGGMGMVLLAVTIFGTSRGKSSHLLYMSEAREEKVRPSILATIRELWKLYASVTLASTVYLVVGLSVLRDGTPLGTVLWNAINFAMTAISTGGFSVLDHSVGTYDSVAVRMLFVPLMILGAIAYPVYYAVLREGDTGKLRRSPQTRWLFLLVLLGVPILTLLNATETGFWHALPSSLFQYVSGLSTTGFQTAPIGDWTEGAVVFLVAGAMVIGGSAGATVGGIKILRAYLIGRGILWEISRSFLPEHAVVELKVGDETLTREEMEQEFAEAAIISFLYIVSLAASLVVLMSVLPERFTLADVLLEVASAQSTVGVSSGITGPRMPATVKLLFVFLMGLGRLEFVTILVTIRALLFGFSAR